MHGGADTHLADKLRRLLAYLGAGLAVATGGELVFAILQLGRSFGNNAAGIDVALLWGGIGLLAAACGLLLLGSIALIGRSGRARLILLDGSVLWLGAAACFITLQVSYARRAAPATPNATWQTFARQVEYWITTAGALPLLLLAFAGWREVLPRPTVPVSASSEWPADTDRASLATRLMRVLSVYGIVFGGTSLIVLIYIALTSRAGFPDLRLPYSFAAACLQTSRILEWSSAALLVAGAIGEIAGRQWGRKVMLIGAAAWVGYALASFGWTVLIDTRGSANIGRLVTTRLATYSWIFLITVTRNAYPLMLLVCLRWPEVRGTTDARSSVGFQPILTPSRAEQEGTDPETGF